MENLEMDIFADGDFEDGDELESLLQQLNPSEVEIPESVASNNTDQDGEAPNKASLLEQDEEVDLVSPKNSLYSSLANVLYNEGVLPNLDLKTKKVNDIDDLVEAIKTEIQANEFGGLNDRQKKYLEALKSGLPEEVFFDVEKVNYTLESMTDEVLENEENIQVRTGVIKEYFMLKGLDEDEAEKLTQQQVDLATDVEFSKKARNYLGQYNEGRLTEELKLVQENKRLQEESFNKLKSTIETTNKVIDGLPIDAKGKKEILEIITKPVVTLQDGTPLNQIMKLQAEDPIDFQYKLAYLIYQTKGFKDFSAFTTVKKAKTQAVREFEDILQKSTLDLSGGLADTESMDFGKDFILDL
jgi:hypothetical protein